jgi:hypothetical protein
LPAPKRRSIARAMRPAELDRANAGYDDDIIPRLARAAIGQRIVFWFRR